MHGRRGDAGSGSVEHALLTALIAIAIIAVAALGHSVATRSVNGLFDVTVPTSSMLEPTQASTGP